MRAPLQSVQPVAGNASNWVVEVAAGVGGELVCNNTTLNQQLTFHDGATLQTVWHCSPHTANVTDFHQVDSVVVSCSRDGSVRTFDRRAGKPGPTLRCSGDAPLLSCSSRGTAVAVADGASVWLFDLRTGRPLRKFDESHSDDVTVVRFMDGANTLVSAGVDGLVCVYDCNVPSDDDALLDVLNEETSVARIGFLEQKMWLTTDMGGASVWSTVTAERVWTNPHIAQQVRAQWALGCLSRLEGRAVCGHVEGNVSIVNAAVGQIDCILQGGHTAAVRSCIEAPVSGRLVTSAEDGRLVVWGDHRVVYDAADAGPVRTRAK